jgi:hypothetical protein
MRITEIRATNYLSHRDLAISIPRHANVLFICGDNGVGKTAIASGIKLALTGEPIRGIGYKKDIAQLITQGESKGDVTVLCEVDGIPRTYKLGLKTGNHSASAPPLDGSPLSLEPEAYFAMELAERRKLLFGMAGVEVKASTVTDILVKKGHDEARVAAALKYIKLGFDGAAKEAKELASQARGAWKSLTGENYGEAKADGWRAASPSFDELPDIEALQAQVNTLADEEAERKTIAYDLQRRFDAHKAAESAQAAVEGIAAAEAALASRTAEREELAAKLAELAESAAYKGSHTYTCPSCASVLALADGQLVAWEAVKPKHDPIEAGRAVADLRQQLGDLDSRIRNLESTIARGKASQELLDSLPERTTAKEVEAANGLHAAKVAEVALAKADLNRATNAQAEAAQVEERTRKARDHHLDVVGFTKLAEALVALPAEFLGSTVATFNELLREASAGLETMVQMGNDLELYYGTTPYPMASDSQQWRVRMAMAYALAVQGGLRVMVLDHFDVVAPKHRGPILKWLSSQAEVQVILAGTLKEMPKLPAAFHVEWLG